MKTLSGISQILFNRFYCIFRTLRFLYFGNSIVRCPSRTARAAG